jgi:hypothetical protein
MAGMSTITEVVAIRLPKEVVAKARANAQSQDRTLSNYLARILVTQLTRKR